MPEAGFIFIKRIKKYNFWLSETALYCKIENRYYKNVTEHPKIVKNYRYHIC